MVLIIWYFINMDRVVFYKFNDDYLGKVIVEVKVDDMDLY